MAVVRDPLAGVRMLVTAGPTWVALDRVRVITSIFSGSTGIDIARAAARRGADVTLLLGPGRSRLEDGAEGIRVQPYVFYDELAELVRREVSAGAYRVVIHSAAVADYQPESPHSGKWRSGAKEMVVRLKPTAKLVDRIKLLDPGITLVMFKLEVGRSQAELVEQGLAALRRAGADLVVVNELESVRQEHTAFLVEPEGGIVQAVGREQIAARLLEWLERRFARAE
ncbi:MAG TPA: phosphopantothenoylcysteine decarboxylase [Acidobacteriota bacterium]